MNMSYDIKSLRVLVKSMRLLIVDDEEVLLLKTSRFMHNFFDNIDTANNGKEALALFNAGIKYDLVLTDIYMPSMDGWELIEQLKIISPDLFIAAMSGSATIEQENLDMCDIYLKKPASLDDMLILLNRLIQKKGLDA